MILADIRCQSKGCFSKQPFFFLKESMKMRVRVYVDGMTCIMDPSRAVTERNING